MANKQFGIKLKQLRIRNRLTQKDVYEQLGVSQSTFSSWEIGKSEPDAMTFLKLCRLYKVDDILMEFTGESLRKEVHQTVYMFDQLDVEDKAEIRGEMKHMLKAAKYNKPSISAEIADDITKLTNMPTRTKSK